MVCDRVSEKVVGSYIALMLRYFRALDVEVVIKIWS